MKLPKVHLAVNIGGLALAVGSALMTTIITNPGPIIGLFPAKDALAVGTIIGVIASFLPTKHPDQTQGQVQNPPADNKS